MGYRVSNVPNLENYSQLICRRRVSCISMDRLSTSAVSVVLLAFGPTQLQSLRGQVDSQDAGEQEHKPDDCVDAGLRLVIVETSEGRQHTRASQSRQYTFLYC